MKEKLSSTRNSDYDAEEMSAEELLENVEEVEEAVYEDVAGIEENGATVDSVLELAEDLADAREMEDSMLQEMANLEPEEEEFILKVFIASCMSSLL